MLGMLQAGWEARWPRGCGGGRGVVVCSSWRICRRWESRVIRPRVVERVGRRVGTPARRRSSRSTYEEIISILEFFTTTLPCFGRHVKMSVPAKKVELRRRPYSLKTPSPELITSSYDFTLTHTDPNICALYQYSLWSRKAL